MASEERRWVVKVGSSLITDGGRGLDRALIQCWAEQIAGLMSEGMEVVLVSSGAVAEGMARLGWQRRPHALHALQAAAAVGQMGVIQAYEESFRGHGRHTAQILLTHEDLSHRVRYLNARSTLRTLLGLGVIPVVNENDTVGTDEIRFGDNDTLAALVANLIEADRLILLTDQAGMYDRDPRRHRDARLIREARADDPRLEEWAQGGAGTLGRGGMLTKVRAAKRAARSGTITLITDGREPDILGRILRGDDFTGTTIHPTVGRLNARKQWLAGQLQVRGRLHLDEGAVRALVEEGRSLLPVGVRKVEGVFQRGEVVACLAPDGREIARGLVNYNSEEAGRIQGHPSSEIEAILGYVDEPELIHRDDLVLL